MNRVSVHDTEHDEYSSYIVRYGELSEYIGNDDNEVFEEVAAINPYVDAAEPVEQFQQEMHAPYADARRYFERIRDWNTPEFLGIHYKKKNPHGGRPFWHGQPVRSVEEAILKLQVINNRADTLDIYAALGTQRDTETKTAASGRAYQVALRNKENTVGFKTLFMDVDVKPDAYATTEEALQAVNDFCSYIGLPQPNMIVLSGTGGAHIYFVLDRSLPRDKWSKLAEKLVTAAHQFGLKFDAQCTTDAARILRVPDTLNFKRDDPLPVTMLRCDDPDIPVEDMEAALAGISVTPTGKSPANSASVVPEVELGPVSEKMKQAFAELTPLQLIGGGGERLRKIDEVAEHCPWIEQSLTNGGADNDNALRLLAYKIANGCYNVDETAWRMMANRATLSKEEFAEQLERSKREVTNNPKLPWVTCNAVASAGSKACAVCQHRDKGLRPLTVGAATVAQVNTLPLSDVPLPDIPGGVYDAAKAMREINARFALVDRDGEVVTIHRGREGKDDTLSKGSFDLWLKNIYVRIPSVNGDKHVPAGEWWLRHPDRPTPRTAVFKPHGPTAANEYNFWRGFAVQPQLGTDKVRRLLRHIHSVICREDKKKFRYLIRWLAWTVQNPDQNPETAIVLKSEGEGSGKSTLSEVMRRIIGVHHAMKVSTPAQIFAPHVDYLEFMCFLMVEEAVFAGDPRVADLVKDFITGSTIHINPKGRKAYSAPNRISAILTTNHDWAVPAGKSARRWFVCEVDESRTFDRIYFDAMFNDLAAGGYGQFLRFLLNVKLGPWHPRNLFRTKELREQQLLSAPPIKQWLRDCAEDGEIARWSNGLHVGSLDLGVEHTTADLYDAYCGARKASSSGGRVESRQAFGRVLMNVLGSKAHNHNVTKNGKRAPGYFIPDADTLVAAVERDIVGIDGSE